MLLNLSTKFGVRGKYVPQVEAQVAPKTLKSPYVTKSAEEPQPDGCSGEWRWSLAAFAAHDGAGRTGEQGKVIKMQEMTRRRRVVQQLDVAITVVTN